MERMRLAGGGVGAGWYNGTMFAGKPVIGIVGGIGSGKSFVARQFAELGCLVIDSDRQVAEAYGREEVKRTLRAWWGEDVLNERGEVDRKRVGRRVFANEPELRRLEGLLYPIIAEERDRMMEANRDVVAYVWDAPMLIEAGLAERCDAVVFVEAPDEQRRERVGRTRGWSEEEWSRREKLQLPLDKKREIANYIVRNTAGAEEVRSQVREVLSRIVARNPDGKTVEEGS